MNIYMGIDWSQDKHDVSFMNAAGAIIARLIIAHQPDFFRELETTRQQLGVTAAECLVGLETTHYLLLDYLWDHGYRQIYVIPPLVVKSSRGRYGHNASGDDTLDAQLLADLLRTDRAQLLLWQPDSQPSDSGLRRIRQVSDPCGQPRPQPVAGRTVPMLSAGSVSG